MRPLDRALRLVDELERKPLHLIRAQDLYDTADLVRGDARAVVAAGEIETGVSMAAVVVGMRRDADALASEWLA